MASSNKRPHISTTPLSMYFLHLKFFIVRGLNHRSKHILIESMLMEVSVREKKAFKLAKSTIYLFTFCVRTNIS